MLESLQRQLLEQRPDVQRTTLGVLADPLGGPEGQLLESHEDAELPDGGGIETGQAEQGSTSIGHKPLHAFEQLTGDAVPRADQGEDTVRLEAAQREQECLQGGSVGPLRIVDDQPHRRPVLQGAEQLHQSGSDGDGIAGPAGGRVQTAETIGYVHPCRPHQLRDDPVGEEGLHLLTGRPKGPELARLAQIPADQRGLPHPGGPLHDDQTGTPSTRASSGTPGARVTAIGMDQAFLSRAGRYAPSCHRAMVQSKSDIRFRYGTTCEPGTATARA